MGNLALLCALCMIAAAPGAYCGPADDAFVLDDGTSEQAAWQRAEPWAKRTGADYDDGMRRHRLITILGKRQYMSPYERHRLMGAIGKRITPYDRYMMTSRIGKKHAYNMHRMAGSIGKRSEPEAHSQSLYPSMPSSTGTLRNWFHPRHMWHPWNHALTRTA